MYGDQKEENKTDIIVGYQTLLKNEYCIDSFGKYNILYPPTKVGRLGVGGVFVLLAFPPMGKLFCQLNQN